MRVLIISSILLIIMLLTSCKEVIMHNLDETQANKVSVILHEYNVEVEKVKSGNSWNIQVDSGQVSSALQILDKNRFLKRLASKPKENKNNLMVSREERQRWLEREQAFNLEETLEAVPEILEARIHFYFSQPNDFDVSSQSLQRTASVLLVIAGKNKPENKLEALRDLAIKLISGATGIKESSISIVMASEKAFPLLSGKTELVEVPTEAIFIGGASLILFLGIGFVMRKRFKNAEKREDEDGEDVVMTEKATKLNVSAREGKYGRVADDEIDAMPIGAGDLKSFRYMNQELF